MKKERKPRQRIPDNTKEAIILAYESGMTHKNIAKTYSVSYGAVEANILKYKKFRDRDVTEIDITKSDRGSIRLYSNIKKDIQEKFTKHCDRVLESITKSDYDKASLSQKAVASGIFIEKSLLLKGEATQITSQLAQKPTRELLKEFSKQSLKDSKDTQIILDQDGSLTPIKTIPAEPVKAKDGNSNV